MTWNDLISVVKGLQAENEKVIIERESGENLVITGIEARKDKVALKVVIV